MPRGCKLGLGPHSAGSCAGTSDDNASALGSLQFCKCATQMYLQDPFDLEVKERQDRFRLPSICSNDEEQATTLHWSEPRRVNKISRQTAGCLPVALSVPGKRAKLHTGRLGLPASPEASCCTLRRAKVTPSLPRTGHLPWPACPVLEPALRANRKGHAPTYTRVIKISHLIC